MFRLSCIFVREYFKFEIKWTEKHAQGLMATEEAVVKFPQRPLAPNGTKLAELNIL